MVRPTCMEGCIPFATFCTNSIFCLSCPLSYTPFFLTTILTSKAVAIPEKAKRTISLRAQEVVRILRNCSRMLPWKEVCGHVEEFCMIMQYSGYTEAFRVYVGQRYMLMILW